MYCKISRTGEPPVISELKSIIRDTDSCHLTSDISDVLAYLTDLT